MTPNPKYIYKTESYHEVVSNLKYCISQSKGLVVVAGEVGTGKTTTLRSVLQQFGPDILSVYLFNPFITVSEFFELFTGGLNLGLSPSASKAAILTALCACLARGLAPRPEARGSPQGDPHGGRRAHDVPAARAGSPVVRGPRVPPPRARRGAGHQEPAQPGEPRGARALRSSPHLPERDADREQPEGQDDQHRVDSVAGELRAAFHTGDPLSAFHRSAPS